MKGTGLEISLERSEDGKKISCFLQGDHRLSTYVRDALWLEYDVSLATVPEDVMVVPFLAILAPIVWLTGEKLVLPRLDQDYAAALERQLALFKRYYPHLPWTGSIEAEQLAVNPFRGADSSAILFSGGVDSLTTYYRRLKPDHALVTVWGVDIMLNQPQAWKAKQDYVRQFSAEQGMAHHFIRTNLREALLEEALCHDFHVSWWPGIAHGTLIAALCFPLAQARGWQSIVEASGSPQSAGEKFAWGANPELVGSLECAGVAVQCDGAEMTRQEKMVFLGRVIRDSQPGLQFRVCWHDKQGGNCGCCEKCCRTMTGMLLEGLEPVRHGFPLKKRFLPYVRNCLESGAWVMTDQAAGFWEDIGTHYSGNDRSFPLADPEAEPFFAWLATMNSAQLLAVARGNRRYRLRLLLEQRPGLLRLMRNLRRLFVNR